MIFQVGVKAFLKNKEGKYLLIKRSPVKYPEVSNPRDIVCGRGLLESGRFISRTSGRAFKGFGD